MRIFAQVLAFVVVWGFASPGAMSAGSDEPTAGSLRADDSRASNDAGSNPADTALAEELTRLRAEYDKAQRAYYAFFRGSTIPDEDRAKAAEVRPDFPTFVRRVFVLAAATPADPAVRDTLLWMMTQFGQAADNGPYPGEFALAATWLVRHFGDDPDAVRVGLGLDNVLSPYRDHLLLSFYASAKNWESKGLARLALAQYLQRKAQFAEGARKIDGRQTYTHELVRADGSTYTQQEVQSDESYAYILHLKQCDAGYLRGEAERLYNEVIAEYGDVPFVTTRERELQRLLEQPEPTWNGEPLTQEARRQIEERLARRRTLGEVAEARLDDWFNLAVDKPAPEIEGIDVHGRPLKLSDHRGKVVALVFWGSWCGPCMREVPREKALVERMAGRPFVILGVNTDGDAETARDVMAAEGMTWPNWHDGEPGAGPIAQLYHVRGYPTAYVIDAEGTIRSKNAQGESLERLVEELVAEAESRPAAE